MKEKCGHPITINDVIDCANSFITGSILVTATNRFYQYNLKTPIRKFGITRYINVMRRN